MRSTFVTVVLRSVPRVRKHKESWHWRAGLRQGESTVDTSKPAADGQCGGTYVCNSNSLVLSSMCMERTSVLGSGGTRLPIPTRRWSRDVLVLLRLGVHAHALRPGWLCSSSSLFQILSTRCLHARVECV